MRRGLWDRETVALLLIAAVLPMAAAWLWWGGAGAAGRLVWALAVSGAWHLVFMLARAQPPSFAGALAGFAVAVLSPEAGPLQLALGITFGMVLGELVFGGWGRNFLHPAAATAMFLGFGYPTAAWPALVLPVAWAAIPAVLIGVAFGVMPWRTAAGAVLAGAVAVTFGPPGLAPFAAAGAVVLALIVLDPVAGAATSVGRWLHGASYAGFLALFATGWVGVAPVQAAVTAAFLAALAAPLLDEIAIQAWLMQRRRRHG
ncbi:NADH-quinone reductase [Paracoccus sp. S-4012]|uniref:RnfABCDGE type electron transport complex subunit D n=1 Tax=Paracoccus sp. S-4012 TaxID=2665648 RepID=UPI0012B0ADE5|nr:RnfABCDGE type electron transport complex subunit D [Paracoccus sp. S-4012]MRX49484.1 NADH-quinone reductase [Paracoccus sp. S-4012]